MVSTSKKTERKSLELPQFNSISFSWHQKEIIFYTTNSTEKDFTNFEIANAEILLIRVSLLNSGLTFSLYCLA